MKVAALGIIPLGGKRVLAHCGLRFQRDKPLLIAAFKIRECGWRFGQFWRESEDHFHR